MTRALLAVVVVVVAGLASCAPPPAVHATARAWPEADLVFQRDARFLGADSAYSVSLGGDRVLWLFGDTFVALDDSRSRHHAKMVRNSVAVMSGTDPSSPATTVAYFFGGTAAAPSSFFADGTTLESDGNASTWTWPGTPVLVDGKLLLFLWSMKRICGDAFGFRLDHTRAILIDNPGDDPSAWRSANVTVPKDDEGVNDPIAWGTGAALVDGDTLWLLGAREPGDHRMFLAHVNVHDAARGDLSRLAVVGDAGFATGTEASLTHTQGAFEVISVDGLGNVPLVMRSATALAPSTLSAPTWSAPVALFLPALPKGAFDYSAKAHPELHAGDGAGDVVVTYCSNGELAAVVDDMSLYFPRFVRVTLAPKTQGTP